MEVKAVQSTDWASMPQPIKQSSTELQASLQSASAQQGQTDTTASRNIIQGEKTEYSEKELLPITKELNKFFEYLNADIRFELHDGTQRLIVQIVDIKENKVLREFPPRELLDKIANVREYVGILLDKKA